MPISLIRPVRGITAAEADVLDAATRVVDGDPDRYPHLTRSVNALHLERQSEVSTEEFNARMLALAPTSLPVDALRRSDWTVYELMFTLTGADVMDIRNAGWHSWAIWYLTCEQFGIEPPWAAALLTERQFREQLEHERVRLRAEAKACR